MAVAPDTSGAGRVAGQDSAIDPVPCAKVIRGVLPPPDRVRFSVVAAGDRVPSALVCKVVSIGTHVPFFWVRTGTRFDVAVNVPSGLAITCRVGVVSAVTSTGFPVCTAISDAVGAGMGAGAGGGGSTGGCPTSGGDTGA
ncbi:hypothetical protein LWP59_10615 [Amycolatopsis acidiphila]|uniref:hypothetical protein n=1 Tax=Amycolatopsis acidiphila TaxID=715473 RepID=UPI00174B2939|nr:hypothetical protein [Amycolatopsis acidiphila]UIJ62037.1 hypothetical protein LWP59_10615 [Amycolatopsis acidiphila]